MFFEQVIHEQWFLGYSFYSPRTKATLYFIYLYYLTQTLFQHPLKLSSRVPKANSSVIYVLCCISFVLKQ